ncbi:MAG: hypothetical protein M3315_01140 [Actinomycetota bacterium]|nr:hypothetical protein [Actinomycetota bacterium]
MHLNDATVGALIAAVVGGAGVKVLDVWQQAYNGKRGRRERDATADATIDVRLIERAEKTDEALWSRIQELEARLAANSDTIDKLRSEVVELKAEVAKEKVRNDELLAQIERSSETAQTQAQHVASLEREKIALTMRNEALERRLKALGGDGEGI